MTLAPYHTNFLDAFYGNSFANYDPFAVNRSAYVSPFFSSAIAPTYTPATVSPFAAPAPSFAPIAPQKQALTPERVEKLLEGGYAKLDALGNQLRAAASELEELRAEIVTANNVCDSELRAQLQSANDEIFRLRNLLSEAAERKANKLDKKDL